MHGIEVWRKSPKSAVKWSEVKWNGVVANLNGVKPHERVVKVVGWSLNERKWSVDNCSEVELSVFAWSVVKVLETGCLTLSEDI